MNTKRFSMGLLAAGLLFGLVSSASSCIAAETEQLRTVTDMDGRQIEVPVDPQRIACFHGVSSDRITMLGKGGSLIVSMEPSPWAKKLYPELKNIKIYNHPTKGGSVEQLLSLNTDLVLYSPNPGEAEKFRAAGLHTACGFSAAKRPRTMDAFFDNFKQQVNFFGDLLGDDAHRRAENYCRYFDEKLAAIKAVTEKIPENKRPRVYYGGRNNDMLATQGQASVLDWVVQLAGGNYTPRVIDLNFAVAKFEDVLNWDPDVILICGWGNSAELIAKNPNWSALRAAKSGQVYLLPSGVFAWEYASGETILLIEYLAKILHPEAFKDLDMVQEAVTFYHDIYGKNVSPADARRILQGLPPEE